MLDTPGIYWAAFGVTLGSLFLMCCFGTFFPVNLGLCFLFTCGETIMVGGITAGYEPKTVV